MLILLPIITFFLSILTTITGFGLSTLSIPIFLFFFNLPTTLLIVGLIHLSQNIWRIVFFWKEVNWHVGLLFLLPGIVFSFFGAKLVFVLPNAFLTKVLALLISLYGLFLFWQPNFSLPAKNRNLIFGGTFSGFLAGLFGMGGAVRSAVLISLPLSANAYIGTNGLIAFFIDLVRVSVYSFNLNPSKEILLLIIILILAIFFGVRIAKKILSKISANHFRKLVALFLFLVGLLHLLR